MKKRVVVVTGAGQGIGLSIVKMFATRGDLVYALDIDKAKLYEAVEGLKKLSLRFVRFLVTLEAKKTFKSPFHKLKERHYKLIY